ncbi:proteasome core particle subunit beta 7 [Sugiyamaella lignohabitans]|uniref:Proteasome core particle subunit beta 7 n=1 Tax=Sugiyamaella lignohabitans TaxID=796027 RepID=A0A161HIY9_9ASCO|nr:proteasome core particle subunit beta 7 [Sugiyamaella lignohabitans]ANB12587.1 proteasome core particle subunit beta 7 [Sugiyamaella lignohabitans]
MEHHQVNWGRPRDDIYGAYDRSIHNATASMPTVHTQQPIVTGTSVIGIKFDKGVIIAADNLGKLNSLAQCFLTGIKPRTTGCFGLSGLANGMY